MIVKFVQNFSTFNFIYSIGKKFIFSSSLGMVDLFRLSLCFSNPKILFCHLFSGFKSEIFLKKHKNQFVQSNVTYVNIFGPNTEKL